MINATTMSRARHAGPSSAASSSLRAIAATAATSPCGSDRALLNSLPAGISVCPFVEASIAATSSGGSFDRFAGSVAHLGPVAERAPQQDRLVDAFLARLRHVPALVPGYMHRTPVCSHALSLPRSHRM